MDSQMATHHDAELILKLYDLRREEAMRKARHWMTVEFNPKTEDEFFAVARGSGDPKNAYFRQVVTYWEMAAALVLHGALNADLFLDTNGEGIRILAKLNAYREAYRAMLGRPLMGRTAQLVENYPAAQELFQAMLKSFQTKG